MTGIPVWVGGYTPTMGGTARGIGLLRWHSDDAVLDFVAAIPTSSPSFLAAGTHDVLYATDEAGRIEAFHRGRGFSLEPLGGQPTSGGFPCHVSVTEDRLYVSNYLDGSIDAFPLAADGTIGAVAQTLSAHGSGPNPVQQGAHAHSTLVRGSTVLSADLGADRVHVHTVTAGKLVRNASVPLPPGTGPRDLLALGGRTVLLGELNGAVFTLDARGQITARGTVTETWVDGDHASGLAVGRSGQFLYTGLRGSNRIAVFRSSDLSPVVTVPCGGDWPRHLCVVGDALLVANQLSSTVSAFRLDPTSGIPVSVGSPVEVASPTFLLPVV